MYTIRQKMTFYNYNVTNTVNSVVYIAFCRNKTTQNSLMKNKSLLAILGVFQTTADYSPTKSIPLHQVHYFSVPSGKMAFSPNFVSKHTTYTCSQLQAWRYGFEIPFAKTGLWFYNFHFLSGFSNSQVIVKNWFYWFYFHSSKVHSFKLSYSLERFPERAKARDASTCMANPYTLEKFSISITFLQTVS